MPGPDKRSGPVTTPDRPKAADSTTSTASVHGGQVVDLTAWRLPWTCDPALRWETGQAGACLAAVGILRELLHGDLDPAYWRVRVEHALDALDAAVGE